MSVIHQHQPWAYSASAVSESSNNMSSPPLSPSTPRVRRDRERDRTFSSGNSNSNSGQLHSLMSPTKSSSSKLSTGLQKQKKSPSSSSSKAGSLAHVPCKFFKQGTCQAGDSCPFSHTMSSGAVDAPCKYFQKGNCKFGNKCALAHILPDGRRVNGRHHHSHHGGNNGGNGHPAHGHNNNQVANHNHGSTSNLNGEINNNNHGLRRASGPDGHSHMSPNAMGSASSYSAMMEQSNDHTIRYRNAIPNGTASSADRMSPRGIVPTTPKNFHSMGFGSPDHDSPSIFSESSQFTASISGHNNSSARAFERTVHSELSQSFDIRAGLVHRTSSFMESSPSLPPPVGLAPSSSFMAPRSMSASSTSLWKDRPFIRSLRTSSHLFESSAIEDDDESDLTPTVGPLKQSRWANRLQNGTDFGFKSRREESTYSDDESAIEEEFVPSSLKDLLTPQERERRDSRSQGNISRHGRATFNDYPLFQPVGTPDKSLASLVPAAIIQNAAQNEAIRTNEESPFPPPSRSSGEESEEHHDTQFVMDDLQEKL